MAHVECRNRLPSFGPYDLVSGPFWAKKRCFGAQNAHFWEGTSPLGASNEPILIPMSTYIYIYVYIYPPIYTPLPNSRWLHHTALRYVRRAQNGAYMWWKGLHSVKTGSKRAKNSCLSIPNDPGSLLEKRVFDPFLTHLWSQKGPLSRHFGIFHGPKPVATGSKWATTTCLSIINGPGSFLEKHVFDPFLTHCWFQNGPFSRHFGIFRGPKRATTGSKRPKNTCLSIPSGLGTTLEKMICFAPGTLVHPPLAPTVRGLAGPPAAPSDHWCGGLRVSLGDSEA